MDDESKGEVSLHADAGRSNEDIEFEKAMLELAAEEIPATPAADAQPELAASAAPSICSEQTSVCTDAANTAASQRDDTLIKRREEWLARLKEVAAQQNDANWVLGDLLNDGEGLYADHLAEAESVTGFARSHLRDIASTARRFPKEIRRSDLSWTHHRNLINALPDADADTLKKWLQRAVDRGWSANTFKEEARKGASLEEKRYEVIEVRLPAHVYQTMSCQGNGSVAEIAAQWLTERVAAIQQAYEETIRQNGGYTSQKARDTAKAWHREY